MQQQMLVHDIIGDALTHFLSLFAKESDSKQEKVILDYKAKIESWGKKSLLS